MQASNSPTIIFLSYRREDSIETAGRIFSWITVRTSVSSVFLDVRSIPPGADYRKQMDSALRDAKVVLVIIGKTWNVVPQSDGTMRHRLEEPDDAVRHEIEVALREDKIVVPVLIQGVKMPRADELPASIRQFAYRNAVQVRPEPDFDNDMRVLRDAIQSEADARWHPPSSYTPAMKTTNPEKSGSGKSGGVLSRLVWWWITR